MPSQLPKLDPKPVGTPHDYSLSRIQMVTAPAPVYPKPKRVSTARKLARANQDKGGTCTGFATKFYAEYLYMLLTGDMPTPEDIAQLREDVIDEIGTRYDTGYSRTAITAEGFYQLGRYIGNITYPSGGDIRYTLRAWLKYGWMLESQWHTDKERTCVWTYPPGVDSVRMQANGGVSWDEIVAFGQNHKIEGYAMCGTPDGGAEWDQICSSIDAKGGVLAALPIYENFSSMAGGDGTFPDPSGELAGFHALFFYDYDDDWLYLVHSWGTWCGQFGKISRNYYNVAKDLSVWMVAIDSTDVAVAKELYKTLTVTCNVPARISVNCVLVGISPQKISLEKGKTYIITASADGYIEQSKTVDDSMTEWNVVLDAQWWKPLMDFLNFLIALFKR